jgi:hypothetical protein
MNTFEFHRKLREHCNARHNDHDPDLNVACTHCCFRLYCWTATCDRTDALVRRAIDCFDNPADRTDEFEDEFQEFILAHGADSFVNRDKAHRALARRCIYTD